MRISTVFGSLGLVALAAPAIAQTRFDQVHPIFQAYCTGCHSYAGSGGFNIAQDDVVAAYADSQLASYYLSGQTKGYVSLVRIQNGEMPQNGSCTGDPVLDAGNSGCLTATEQALVQSWIQDGELPPIPTTGTGYCFGSGGGTLCPCGNPGATDSGCANSVSPTGARLVATGNASLASDSVVLRGTRMPNSSALYFQGTVKTASGAGSVLGDGLRCVSGGVIRLGIQNNIAGDSQYPGNLDPSASVRGSIPAAGSTRHYQVWYRNAASFCQVETFNLTNGLSLTWGA